MWYEPRLLFTPLLEILFYGSLNRYLGEKGSYYRFRIWMKSKWRETRKKKMRKVEEKMK